MLAFRSRCDTDSVTRSEGHGSAHHDEGFPAPYGTGEAEQPLDYRPGQATIEAPAPGRRREIVLYFGARRHEELYDLAELHEMELACPWLQVIPAVSDEPARSDVMFGTVPEAAATATLADRDVYVSGPDAMITRTVQVLRERGAPGHCIHYDLGSEAD
jgi:ferredoxin-NADP reductase